MQSWGWLSGKAWRQRPDKEGIPQTPGSDPPEASRAPGGSHTPSSGFGAIIGMTIAHQKTLVCGRSAHHFPQVQPPFSSRVRPQSLGRPLPGFVYLGTQDASPLLLSAGLPATHLTSGRRCWRPKLRWGDWSNGVSVSGEVRGRRKRQKGMRPRRRRGLGVEREGHRSRMRRVPPNQARGRRYWRALVNPPEAATGREYTARMGRSDGHEGCETRRQEEGGQRQ